MPYSSDILYPLVPGLCPACEAKASFNCSLPNLHTRNIDCDVRNWGDAKNFPQIGARLNVVIPRSNTSVFVRVNFICSGRFAQNVLHVTQDGYEQCNGTHDNLGRRHVLKPTQLGDDEARIHAFDMNAPGAVVFHFFYRGQSIDNYYIIGTLQDPKMRNPFDLDSVVGGQCTQGLKTNIQVGNAPKG
eukprot:scpid102552/ scgid11302/ 